AVIFVVLVITNLVWLGVNLTIWATNGLQYLLEGMNFVERLYYSVYLKWILLADGIWLCGVLIFAIGRKQYKTDLNLHYLQYNPIKEPTISVIIPAFNEEN